MHHGEIITTPDGRLVGSIKLYKDTADVEFIPTNNTNEKAPTHAIMAGGAQSGDAFAMQRKNGTGSFFGLKFDSPNWERLGIPPLHLSAFPREGTDGAYDVVWKRKKERQNDGSDMNDLPQ